MILERAPSDATSDTYRSWQGSTCGHEAGSPFP